MRVSKQEILRMELKKLGTHQEIADKIGVTRESVSTLVSRNCDGRNYSSLNILKKISKVYGRDLTWLASGDGKWNL